MGEWGGNTPRSLDEGCRDRVTLGAPSAPLAAEVAWLPDRSSGLGAGEGEAGQPRGTASAMPCCPACPWGPRGHGGFERSAHSSLCVALAGLPCLQAPTRRRQGPGTSCPPLESLLAQGQQSSPAASVRAACVEGRTAWVFESRRQRGRGGARAAQQARPPRRSARAASPCCRRRRRASRRTPRSRCRLPRSRPRSPARPARSPAPTSGRPGRGPPPPLAPAPPPAHPPPLCQLRPRPVPQQLPAQPLATAFPEPSDGAHPAELQRPLPRTAEHPR